MKVISHLRQEYQKHSLKTTDVHGDPIEQFRIWFKEALEAEIYEANAMVLATCGHNFKPSARIVLLKEISHDGFIFYSNYKSHKGQQIDENPLAGLTFFWKELERQVRIEGSIKKIDREFSVEYFRSRPRGSKIGTVASPQSRVISLEELEAHFQTIDKSFGEDVPCPEHWGGYLVKPDYFEFWQGRPNRLHDRICYSTQNQNPQLWEIKRLAP